MNENNEIKLATGYEWCLEANLRILDLSQWKNPALSSEQSYFEEKISAKEFYSRLEHCEVKPNSQPRKTEMYLEYRMYGLVNYQFSGTIHAGIQHSHAVTKYQRAVVGTPMERIYNKWADFDVTVIILNGGTTNSNPERLGTLNKHFDALFTNSIIVQPFCEPDLGDELTAIAFLVDERVFNRELYPDFIEEKLPWGRKKPSEKELSELDIRNEKNRERWVEKIGGANNAWLREYLRPLRLA